jgi:hypothetical protein
MPADTPTTSKVLTKEERQARRARRLGAAGVKAAPAPVDAASGVRLRPSVLKPRGGAERAPNSRKVFVIGFQKTGTTTMTVALRTLGLSVAHPSQTVNLALKGKDLPKAEADETVRKICFDFADRTDAAQDSPIFLLFKELDARYPGSKFIYTERDVDSWIASAVNHFGSGKNALHEWMYGVPFPKGNEDIWRKRFLEHRDEVRTYFADRPGDIAYMNLSKGDGWFELVSFLGPELLPPFPHSNKRR